MDIGKRIYELRTNQKMSAKDLAKKVGVSAAFISALEHHTTSASITTLENLCNGLDVSLSEFFQEEEAPLDVELFHKFANMNTEQKTAILNLIEVFCPVNSEDEIKENKHSGQESR
ncbi:helix-turn-helix transcriptional regulator [Tetragenococcus halophilus]|uniref:helix-turn-helix domain-containing protein n=1 Tax=Tetragenococcus halophilus TaxID=51669 RepID=UPI0030C987E2